MDERARPLERSDLDSDPLRQFNRWFEDAQGAVRAPDVLPIYGSSELIHPIPDRSSAFFRTAPTGFQVSPVGKAGSTSMIILEKLGGLGTNLRGKRVAISLSPSWFFVLQRICRRTRRLSLVGAALYT